ARAEPGKASSNLAWPSETC
ncbi:hypothetical protein A2U01_0112570, partial [Trifolium medium]|nr:hypothetical protein [Trifolium medium]